MKLFENFRKSQEVKQAAIEKIDAELLADEYEVEIVNKDGSTSIKTRRNNPTHMAELLDMKRKIKLNGIETGDVLKVVANVAIVAVLVSFEISSIMNQKGSRFIKVL